MTYQIKIDVFEGPFDLLLTLVSRQQVDIYDVPIAVIADEYLAYINKMRELDLEVASEFLLVAATLLDMKAKSLLPRDEDEFEQEELPLRETKDMLIARLLEYKKFKNVALELAGRFEAESKYYPREAELEEAFIKLLPDYLKGVTVADLAQLASNLISRTKKEIFNSTGIIAIKPINLEEKIDEVIDKLKKSRRQTFKKLTLNCKTKTEVIAFFLALLELYKRGLITLYQAVTFGDIEVELTEALN